MSEVECLKLVRDILDNELDDKLKFDPKTEVWLLLEILPYVRCMKDLFDPGPQ